MASFAAEPDDGPTDDTLMQAMARMIWPPNRPDLNGTADRLRLVEEHHPKAWLARAKVWTGPAAVRGPRTMRMAGPASARPSCSNHSDKPAELGDVDADELTGVLALRRATHRAAGASATCENSN